MDRSSRRRQKDPKKFVTTEQLGLRKFACLLCGELEHMFKKCPLYPNEEPYTTVCRFCRKGAHNSYSCKQRPKDNTKRQTDFGQKRGFGKQPKN